MSAKQVWHKTFGYGSIVDIFKDYTLINFEIHGEKEIPHTAWGTILFFSIEDYQDIDKEKIKAKYSEYLHSQTPLVYNKVLTQDTCINEECREVFNFPTIDKRMLFESFSGTIKRNIVIILCQTITIANKRFLRIIGIDILTGKVVNIVDTNGSEYGFHSYNKEFAKLSEQMVIQAQFKIIASDFHLNTLRIVSALRIIEKIKVSKLREKYVQSYPNNSDFIHSFDDVFKFCDSHKNSRSYFIVNFTGTEVKLHKNKYQLKMNTYFVDIRDIKQDFTQIKEKYYHGWIVMQCDVDPNGEKNFLAQRLLGKFLNKQEFEKYQKNRMSDCYSEDDYALYENADFKMEESCEYDKLPLFFRQFFNRLY